MPKNHKGILFHSHGLCLLEPGSGDLRVWLRFIYSFSSDLFNDINCDLSSELGIGRQQGIGLIFPAFRSIGNAEK